MGGGLGAGNPQPAGQMLRLSEAAATGPRACLAPASSKSRPGRLHRNRLGVGSPGPQVRGRLSQGAAGSPPPPGWGLLAACASILDSDLSNRTIWSPALTLGGLTTPPAKASVSRDACAGHSGRFLEAPRQLLGRWHHSPVGAAGGRDEPFSGGRRISRPRRSHPRLSRGPARSSRSQRTGAEEDFSSPGGSGQKFPWLMKSFAPRL